MSADKHPNPMFSLHAFVSHYAKENSVPEAILQEKILQKNQQREVAVTQE